MRSNHDQRIFNAKFIFPIENIDDTDLKNLIQALKRELKRRKETDTK
jgi:hypothetical protein